VEVVDACSETEGPWLIEVMSDEPDNSNGDGNTVDDIQGGDLGTEDYHVMLRSERAGPGDGRTYTLVYAAEDEFDNRGRGHGYVVVPHDQGD
jgi:hypothetical protein